MIELKWNPEWNLGVANLDYHHTNTFNEINKLLILIDDQGQSTAIDYPKLTSSQKVVSINHEKNLHTFIDNKLMPCIFDLKNEITKYLDIIDEEGYFIKNLDFYRRDYLTLMAEVQMFIKELRHTNALSINYSGVAQIKIWFSLHMKCLQKIVTSFS